MYWKTARTYSEEFLQEILQRVGMEMLRWKDLMETFQGSHSPGSTYRQYGQVIGPTSNKHPTKSSSCQTHKMQGAKGRLEAPHASSSKMSGELVPFFLTSSITHCRTVGRLAALFCFVLFFSPSRLPPAFLIN